jgi:hypothetical protein
VKKCVRELMLFAEATLDNWSVTQLQFTASQLRSLLQKIDSKLVIAGKVTPAGRAPSPEIPEISTESRNPAPYSHRG